MFPQVFKTQNFIQFQLISSERCEFYPKNTRIELDFTKKFTPFELLLFCTFDIRNTIQIIANIFQYTL